MFSEGDPIKVRSPDGNGWIRAKFGEVEPDKLKHIDHPGLNDGKGYESVQAWVIYEEGELAGFSGLHPIREDIRPADFED